MKVLIACEFSGTVRDAFIAAGHEAISCDLIPTESPGPHIVGDVRTWLGAGWDLMIAHPPCTHLAICGNRWMEEKEEKQKQAIEFALTLWNAPIPRICLEQPITILGRYIGKKAQIVHPGSFGHIDRKPISLFLKNLPQLRATHERSVLELPFVHHMAPGPNRGKERSRFFTGVAKAFAQQFTEALNHGASI